MKITRAEIYVTYLDGGIVKYYTGSTWQDCTPYYYDGSSWKQCTPYYYDGSAWKQMKFLTFTKTSIIIKTEIRLAYHFYIDMR